MCTPEDVENCRRIGKQCPTLPNLLKSEDVEKKRQRHDYEFIKQLERNKLYRCRLCGHEMQGNLELVLCPPDCQHEIHFCKKEEVKP